MPAALEVDWKEVEKAAIAGVPYSKIADTWQIKENAIRQRAWREKWAVPNRITQMAKEYGVTSCNEGGQNKQIARVAGDSLAEIQERHPLRLAKYLEDKLKLAIQTDTLPVPANWKDANTADSMLRRSLGLDKPQTNVQLNLWNSTGSVGSNAQNVIDPYEA